MASPPEAHQSLIYFVVQSLVFFFFFFLGQILVSGEFCWNEKHNGCLQKQKSSMLH